MEKSTVYDQLLKKIGRSDRGAGLSRSDLDEIVILSQACTHELPPRFTEIVKAYDKSFSPFVDGKIEFISRLLRIIDVSKDIPERSVNADPSEELNPTFKLGKSELQKVIKLCSDMRKIIFSSTVFDAPHKRRLLNRIAAIEREIEQPRGLFDIVRGGINDLGETLGKFGVDVKPLTDRMAEVVGIVRSQTEEYNQLPAPDEIKRLPKPD